MSIFDMLIECTDADGKQWSDEFLALQISTFFFGAFVNTANTLCLAVALIAENQSTQREVSDD